MNLNDFEALANLAEVYCEFPRIKGLFPDWKEEMNHFKTKKLRLFFMAVLQGSNEGMYLQLKVCYKEKNEFVLFYKFYGFEEVVKAIHYIHENCRCF